MFFTKVFTCFNLVLKLLGNPDYFKGTQDNLRLDNTWLSNSYLLLVVYVNDTLHKNNFVFHCLLCPHWLYLFPSLQTMQSRLLLDKSSAPHSDQTQMRATPPHSSWTIMTLLETCQSTLSHFLQNQSMPRRSLTHPVSSTCQGRSAALIESLHQHQSLELRSHPATPSMTAPHTGCSPTATALQSSTPMARDQLALCTLNPSHVTLYRGITHTRNPCEHSELRHREETDSC